MRPAGTIQATGPAIRVMQIVLSLHTGGLERVVIDLVQSAGADFEMIVCCLEETGAWANEVPRVIALGKKPGIDWSLFCKIRRLALQENVRVIHTHNATAHFYGAIGAKLAGARVLHTEHGVNIGREAQYARLNRIAAPFTDISVSVSKWRDDVPVVPNGIHVERFAQSGTGFSPVSGLAKLNGRDARSTPLRRVGSVGRLVQEKNYPLLIRAVAGIPGAELILVGDGPLRSELEQQVKRTSRPFSAAGQSPATGETPVPLVQFLGVRSDIPELLASLDVFALSSSTEGMSIALLEAMAAGCPIVVTAVGGNTELIQHEVTGLVVPPDDEPALRAAIRRLLDDRALAARLGAAAQTRAREKYGVASMTQRYEELWRRLAA